MSLIQNQLWTTAVLRSQMIDLQNHASCREGIAVLVLVCQLAVGICAEEAVREFSCGYVCNVQLLRYNVHSNDIPRTFFHDFIPRPSVRDVIL